MASAEVLPGEKSPTQESFQALTQSGMVSHPDTRKPCLQPKEGKIGIAEDRHFRKTRMDVMDYFSDRASSRDGASASFLTFPRSAGPHFSPFHKKAFKPEVPLIERKSYLPHTEESIRDGDPPGKHIDSITPDYLS